ITCSNSEYNVLGKNPSSHLEQHGSSSQKEDLNYICLMRIDIITVLPELLESPFNHSMIKRAKTKGLLQVHLHNLRTWAINEYGQVDDYQYGGGAGMVMLCEPLVNAIEELSRQRSYDEV